jgi:predicted PurR-regulated permease PerM
MLTRERGKLIVMSAATIVCVFLCYQLAYPFIPALVWAVTGAVITQPFTRFLRRHILSPSLRAAVSVSVVSIAIFAPVIVLAYFIVLQLGQGVQNWQYYLNEWQEALSREPRVAAAWGKISQNLDLTRALEQLANTIQTWSVNILSGSLNSLALALIALFVLFYLYRDQDEVVAALKRFSPLTQPETSRLLKRLSDTIHGTIFGTVVVAVIQGTLGGLIFWAVGLPGAVLWGTVMALLAIIPYLGAFVVWAPAAVILAAEGQWVKSLILVVWGTVVIGLIDNLIYPILVGNRLRQHTVIAFFAIVGGIALFGTSGLVLGPVLVSLTAFLLETWRRRTADGRTADEVAKE